MEDVFKKSELTPTDYFESIKSKKNVINDNELNEIYDNCLALANKFVITGQVNSARKLVYHLEAIEKEHELIKLGINTFIYREDIEYFIKEVASKVVKIIELERFERDIPDDIVEVIKNTKDIFDQMYVLFTDYTGEAERKVEAERRDKDPILFGVFLDESSRTLINRFYVLGDWEDEYCDLTLDKMVSRTKLKINKDITNLISMPKTVEEIKTLLEPKKQAPQFNAEKFTEEFFDEESENKGSSQENTKEKNVPDFTLEETVKVEDNKTFFSKIKNFFRK